MRVIAFAIILSFLVTGYAAAAFAFGGMAHCPMQMMKDCPMDHGGKKPCTDCSTCFAIPAAVAPLVLLLVSLVAATPVARPARVLSPVIPYKNLRPPNPLDLN